MPPNRRVVVLSAWLNASKSLCRFSSETPMPVSATITFMVRLSSSDSTRATVNETLPVSVNLIALPTRLSITWNSLSGSPRRGVSNSGSTDIDKLSCFSAALDSIRSITSLKVANELNGILSINNCPASILEKSRMSLMMLNSECPERCTFST